VPLPFHNENDFSERMQQVKELRLSTHRLFANGSDSENTGGSSVGTSVGTSQSPRSAGTGTPRGRGGGVDFHFDGNSSPLALDSPGKEPH
jgi:hypothetical protein